jgi:hypothetical protein
MGLPLPLKTRPNMSSDTASFMEEPENEMRVAEVSTPVVPSNTWYKSCTVDATHLDDSLFAADFEDLTTPDGAVGQSELYDFIIRGELSEPGITRDNLRKRCRG